MLKYFCQKSGLLLLIPIIFVAGLCYRIQSKSIKNEVFKSPNISSCCAEQLNDVKLYSKETLSERTSLTVGERRFRVWLEKKDALNRNVERVCKKYGKSLSMLDIQMGMFMYESEHRILFCRNAKVGTTSWIRNFLFISSKYHDLYTKITGNKNLHSSKLLKGFEAPAIANVQQRMDFFQESILFSTVRHPFERIVSAYQDKIVDKKKKYVTHLLGMFGGVSFVNFVTMILDKSAKYCQEMNQCSLNYHWRPFISRCGYCDIPYNIIVKAETIQEDQKYLGLLANVTFAKIESHVSSGGSTRDLAKKYFSELDITMVKKLYEFYKVDFEMFDYNPDEYFKVAKNSS